MIFTMNAEITAEDLGLQEASTKSSKFSQSQLDVYTLAQAEKYLIKQAIEGQNHSQAARSLGITPQALYRKLDKYELRKK